MYQNQRGGFLSGIPPAVKALLIINLAMFVLSFFMGDLNYLLGLYYPLSQQFEPYQIITHMFMHGDILHIFFNMYALWMFGQYIEMRWGAKRFFTYYMITGLGAMALHTFVNYLQISSIMSGVSQEALNMVMNEGAGVLQSGRNYTDPDIGKLNAILNVPTVGASGAVFGLLLAFGMLYPNVELYLFFIPVPIKAKYFVIGYGVLELINGVANQPGDNIAHFAHLGGMLFGFILIKIWKADRT